MRLASNEYASVAGEVRVVTTSEGGRVVKDVVDHRRMGIPREGQRWKIIPSPLCLVCYEVEDTWRKKPIWCACVSRDPKAVSSKTLCGMFVTLPGSYENRVPTCKNCLSKLWSES